MKTYLTTEQVTAMAPDAASVKAGKGLANKNKWPSLGADDSALWGECQGSGKKPYQTRVDFNGPAYKCTCPSRKFPCKHTLGLLYLYAADPQLFKSSDAPGWVTEWLASRQKQQEKRQKRIEKKGAVSDPQAKAKREEQRRKRIQSGLKDLNLWLGDIVRHGLSELESKSESHWEEQAARLVDAQSPGLAAFIRSMAAIVNRGQKNWPEDVLAVMGKLKLIIEGFSRFDSLSEGLQSDLRAVLGWPLEKDEVLGGPGQTDTWDVLGIILTETDKLREQRIWLRGRNCGRFAMILNFAFGTQPLEIRLTPGIATDAELVYYPSDFPLRALIKSDMENLRQLSDFSGFANFEAAFSAFSDALAGNPWLIRFPMSVENVRVCFRDGQFILRDSENRELLLPQHFHQGWELVSISGGHPISVFGEWENSSFLPLSCSRGIFHNLYKFSEM
jgi:hypothetical protein